MSSALHSELRALKRSAPGRRFQDRYEQARRKRAGATITGRIVRIALAVVALAIGVVLVFVPGPAILFFFLAGGLLAAESRLVAKLLDRAEVGLRVFIKWALRRWRALSTAGKGVVVAIGGVVAGGFFFFTWRVMFQ